MYEKVLNESVLAAEIVDRLRDTTDAPLSSCIDAARAVMASISEFVRDDSFGRIATAVAEYEVDVETCRDTRLLEMVAERLEEIFKEKEELSYSASQNDVMLIEYLRIFADTVRKTDSRISMRAASRDDFIWLNSLINLYRMDQNDDVKAAVVSCLDVLTENCRELGPFVVESQLPVIIALHTPPPMKELNSWETRALELLARIFCPGSVPPLSHFDTLDTSFIERLLGHFERHSDQVLACLVNINSSVPPFHDSPVILALSRNRLALFGEVFTSKINKSCSEAGLKMLSDILKADALLEDLFYSNDVVVLKNVLGRELVNNESELIRLRCLEAIGDLIRHGVSSHDLRDSIDQSTVDAALRSELLLSLDSS